MRWSGTSGKRRPMATTHERPEGVDDATVEAVGKISEGYEYLVRARGHLYSLHQLLGRVDILFGEGAELLRGAGHAELAERIERDIVGRNVLDGRWTFQIVEEFDRTYYEPCTDMELAVRRDLMQGRRHVYESEMKDARRTTGEPRHERRPAATHDGDLDAEADGGSSIAGTEALRKANEPKIDLPDDTRI